MVYCIESLKTGEQIFLESDVKYSKKEIEKLIKVIRFDLSHHVNTEDLVRILCKYHGFNILPNIKI